MENKMEQMEDNPFQIREAKVKQQIGQTAEDFPLEPPSAVQSKGSNETGLKLPPPKKKKRPCSLSLDAEIMERVSEIARQRGISSSAVVEACLRSALEQFDRCPSSDHGEDRGMI